MTIKGSAGASVLISGSGDGTIRSAYCDGKIETFRQLVSFLHTSCHLSATRIWGMRSLPCRAPQKPCETSRSAERSISPLRRWWDHLRGRQEYCVQVTHPPEGKATAEAPAGDAPLPAAAAAANGDSSPRSADADGSGSGSGSVGGAASAAAEALGTEAVNGNAAAAAAGEAKSAFPAIIALAVSPRK